MSDIATNAFRRYAEACPYRLEPDLPRRPANALNVEVGTPLPRCRLRTPGNWGNQDPRGARWLLSGGSPLVFGPCSRANCPLKPDHCASCGRMATSHLRINGQTWPSDCKRETKEETHV